MKNDSIGNEMAAKNNSSSKNKRSVSAARLA